MTGGADEGKGGDLLLEHAARAVAAMRGLDDDWEAGLFAGALVAVMKREAEKRLPDSADLALQFGAEFVADLHAQVTIEAEALRLLKGQAS